MCMQKRYSVGSYCICFVADVKKCRYHGLIYVGLFSVCLICAHTKQQINKNFVVLNVKE